MRHYKEPFYSKLFDKGTYSQWEKKGSLTMEQKAARVVDEILENHSTEPLPEPVQKEIQRIVQREQEWINQKS